MNGLGGHIDANHLSIHQRPHPLHVDLERPLASAGNLAADAAEIFGLSATGHLTTDPRFLSGKRTNPRHIGNSYRVNRYHTRVQYCIEIPMRSKNFFAKFPRPRCRSFRRSVGCRFQLPSRVISLPAFFLLAAFALSYHSAIMERLWDMLDGIGSPRVVLAGDFMLDEYVYGDVERISQEAPIPVLRVSKRDYRAGGAGNAASAVAALGGQAECVGVIGSDRQGEKIVELLAEAGVGTAGLVVLPDRPTTVKTRFVGLAQHKNPHQMLRVDEEVVDPIPEEAARRLLEDVTAAMDGNSVLALQDHNKGVLTDETARAMISAARKVGATVLVDPAPHADVSRYRGATLLTPNRHEAALASGLCLTDEASCCAAAKKILERAEARAVVITLDVQGSYLATPEGGRLIPTLPRAVADGTGAGDAVLAMLCVALGGGCEYAAAVELANLAGGLEVERFGVVPVTREEIRDELRRRIGLRRSKVMDRRRLAQELQRVRRDGGRVVFTNGCFDLLHMGHVNYLQQARECGTCLVVAVNSDASVRRLKGPRRPVIGQEERARMLAALECVDYVTLFDEDTPEALLDLLRPEVLVKGGSTDVIVGQDFVRGYGGEVKRLDLVAGMSTTDIIQRILETH